MPESIQARYQRAKLEKECLEGEDFFSDRYKRLREWLVLGATYTALRFADDIPELASEHLRPDFLTFKKDGAPWYPIEVTEALRPGYRRHERYKKAIAEGPKLASLPKPLKDPWKSLRQEISKKANKGYPSNACLIVYLDLWVFDFDDWERTVLERLKEEHIQNPFQDIEHFSRVFVLNSGMDDVLELTDTGPQKR